MDGLVELTDALRDNRMERAGKLCAQLLKAAPDSVELLTVAGSLARRKGELEQALAFFSKAAAAAPSIPELHNNLGVILEDLKRYDEAVFHYRNALALRPRYCEANCNLGNSLRNLGRNHDAISAYRAALAADPAYPDAHYNLGNVLRAEGMWQEAVESYRNLLALQPRHLSGWINLGGSLLAFNRFDEAFEALRRALAIDPGSVDAHWNLALALLAIGDFENGWREYEWRLKNPAAAFSTTFAGKPMWDGSPLDGRTLLLRTEQGFGDALQFFRYIPLLARMGGRIVLECRRELLPLLASQLPTIECFAAGEAPPDFDTYAYFMSLPLLLKTTLPTIPAEIPYIKADPTVAAGWRGKMEGRASLMAGLVWAGSAGYKNDRYRSLPLRLLEPLTEVPGIQLYSLQMGNAAREVTGEPWGKAVCDLSAGIRDFSDTAAIIANLDVVISVDTAVAHLAGAMGKPVLLMLPFSCDWRWLNQRSDSPWYPSMRLYRQPEPGDWESVIAAILRDLSPEQVDTNRLFRAANELRCQGRHEEAIAGYQQLLALRPDCAEIHNNLGLALQDQGRLEEAAASYRRALALKPQLADAHNNLGTVLVSRGDREAAIPCFQRAITLREEYIPAYVNLGSCYQHLERAEEALPVYRRAIALQPRAIEPRVNLGNAHQELMQPRQAIAVYREALQIDPQYPELHWNLALSLLSVGDFERGWQEYEWRFKSGESPTPHSPLSPPRVDPQSPVQSPHWTPGQTILLECEQGLGDTLQFVRYAPLVAALGLKVVLQCQYPSLKPLLERVQGVRAVSARGEAVPPVDCYAPLLSLPRIFGTTLERLPATVPYLIPDPARVAHWRAAIGDTRELKVGLVWKGGPLPKNRACPFAEFAALSGLTGIRFYSLQLGETPDQGVLNVMDLAPAIRDFGDSAAIIANLDLLISVDTASAHLAGGMGAPVWTILPYACDWRWMAARPDSPWYPSMRLFRQDSRGEWSGVMLRIKEALVELASRKSSSARRHDNHEKENLVN